MCASAIDRRLIGQVSIVLFTQDSPGGYRTTRLMLKVYSFHNGSYYGFVRIVTILEIIEAL